MVWAYLAAGVVVVLIGLSFAEVSTMYDRTGGPLVYAEEAMGKTAGFVVGWMVSIVRLSGEETCTLAALPPTLTVREGLGGDRGLSLVGDSPGPVPSA